MIEMKLKVEFPLGAIVRLKVEPPEVARMVTDYIVSCQGVKYVLTPPATANPFYYGHELILNESVPRQFGFTPYHDGN